MELFTVDRDRCKQDGICSAVCPMNLIAAKTDDGFPAPVRLAEQLCMNCGHCVVVCPHDAFSLWSMTSDSCPLVQEDLLCTPEQIEQLFRSRRSIRCFKTEPVPHDTLARLIDMARYAPSAHNAQSVHWQVVEDTAEVHRLAGLVVDWMLLLIREEPDSPFTLIRKRISKAWDLGMDYVCHHAPHLVITHEPEIGVAEVVARDSVIALTYLELAAASLRLGVCWGGFIEMAANAYHPMTQALEMPEGHKVMGAMMIGRPEFRYQRLPLRNEPKVTWR